MAFNSVVSFGAVQPSPFIDDDVMRNCQGVTTPLSATRPAVQEGSERGVNANDRRRPPVLRDLHVCDLATPNRDVTSDHSCRGRRAEQLGLGGSDYLRLGRPTLFVRLRTTWGCHWERSGKNVDRKNTVHFLKDWSHCKFPQIQTGMESNLWSYRLMNSESRNSKQVWHQRCSNVRCCYEVCVSPPCECAFATFHRGGGCKRTALRGIGTRRGVKRG